MKINKYYLISNLGDKVDIDMYYHLLGKIVYVPNSITLKYPINPDGSKTRYLEFLEKVSKTPGIRNKDLVPEFSNIMITGILKYYKLIQSDKGYTLTECGERYLDAVHKPGFKSFEACNEFYFDHLKLTFNGTKRTDTSTWKLEVIDTLPLNGYIFDTSREFKRFLNDNELKLTLMQE